MRACARVRRWKLRSLIKQEEEGTYKSLHKTQDRDYEHFLQDVDTDAEMRQRLNVYKNPAHFRITDEGQVVAPQRAPVAAEGEDEAGPVSVTDGGLIGERCRLHHGPCGGRVRARARTRCCPRGRLCVGVLSGRCCVFLGERWLTVCMCCAARMQGWRKCSTTWCWERRRR